MKKARRAVLLLLGASAATFALLGCTSWRTSGDVGEDGVGVGVLTRAIVSVAIALGAHETSSAVACYDDNRRYGTSLRTRSTSQPTRVDMVAEADLLDDVLERNPPVPGSLFFHETSCRMGDAGRLDLGARQACAVESAARNNPGLQVYLLVTSPVARNWSCWSPAARELLAYPNVHFRRLNVERYLRGTPVEALYTSGALRKSYWPVSHTSDALRFLTLWRYGGTYLDLDVVVTKSLEGLRNFAGAESNTDVAVGVLNLGGDELGRRVANSCVNDIRDNFRGDNWGNNGPGVMTRVLRRLCDVHEPANMTPEKCAGFKVYQPYAFYPVSWNQWKLYFDESSSASTMQLLRDSIAIHVWNKLSKAEEVKVGSSQPYGLIAQEHCPRVYRQSAPVF